MKMRDVLAGIDKVLENLRDRNHGLMEKIGIDPDDPALHPEDEEGGEEGDGEASDDDAGGAGEEGGAASDGADMGGGADGDAEAGGEPTPPSDQFPDEGGEGDKEDREDDDDENMGESTVDEGIVGTLSSLAGSVGGMIAGNAVAPGIGASVGGTVGGTLGGVVGQAVDSDESTEVDEDGEEGAAAASDPIEAPAGQTASEPDTITPETQNQEVGVEDQGDIDGGTTEVLPTISDEELAIRGKSDTSDIGSKVATAVADVAGPEIKQTATAIRDRVDQVADDAQTALRRANSTMDNVDQFTSDGRKFMKGAGLALGVGGGVLLGSMVGGGSRRRRRRDYDESAGSGCDPESVFRSMDEALVNEEESQPVANKDPNGTPSQAETRWMDRAREINKPVEQKLRQQEGIADQGAEAAAPKQAEASKPAAPKSAAPKPAEPKTAEPNEGNFVDGLAADNTLSNSLMGAGAGALAGAAAGAIKHLFSSEKDKRKGSFIGSTLGGAVGGAAIGGIGAGLGTKFAPETTNELVGKAREIAPGVADLADKAQAMAVDKFGAGANAKPEQTAAPKPAPNPAQKPAETDAQTAKKPDVPPEPKNPASGGQPSDGGKTVVMAQSKVGVSDGQTGASKTPSAQAGTQAKTPNDGVQAAARARNLLDKKGFGHGASKKINTDGSTANHQTPSDDTKTEIHDSVNTNEDTIASGAGGLVGHMAGSIGGAMLGDYFGTPAAAYAAEKIGSAAGAAAGAALGAREGKKKKAALAAAAGSALGGGVGAGLGGAVGHNLEESRAGRKPRGKSVKGRSWKTGRR